MKIVMNEDNIYKCEFCGQVVKSAKGLKAHTKACKKNPDHIEVHLSDERKAKISNSLKGKPLTEKQKAARPTHLSEDHKANLRSASFNALTIETCPFCNGEFKKLVNHISFCQMNPDRCDGYAYGHEVSDEVRQRSSVAHKGKPLSAEHKQKIKDHSGGWHQTDEVKARISEAQKDVKDGPLSEATKKKLSKSSIVMWKNRGDEEIKDIVHKIYNTKKENNSFNSSKIEYELRNYFDSNSIEYITQYKSDKYPFMCDFYFPQKDLYVEIQGMWTHGGRPYISTDEECIRQLRIWKERAKTSNFYRDAITTWTISDVKKRETVKINKLNWIEIFSTNIDECLDIILKLL